MRKFKAVLFVLSGIFLFLSIIQFIANINGYILRIQGYFSFSLLLLSTFLYILFGYILVINKAPIYIKILSGIFILFLLVPIGAFIIFPQTEREFITNNDKEVMVITEKFEGVDDLSFYESKNILFSKKIWTCTSSDNYLCSYKIKDIFFIIEDCGRRTCDIEKIELD